MNKILRNIASILTAAAIIGGIGICWAAEDGSATGTAAPDQGVADNANTASPAPEPTAVPVPDASIVPEPTADASIAPDTSLTPDASIAPDASLAPEPTSTPAPTPIPTIEPVSDFFCDMHNGSEFAYVDNGGAINFVPMIASNAMAVAPKIYYDGITYLPFRYLFEDILGFTDITENKDAPGERKYKWEKTDIMTITFTINGEEKVLRSDQQTEYSGKMIDSLKVTEDGVSYVPLRYFEQENLCSLYWDKDTESIVISSTSEYGQECLSKVLGQKLTNNFISYSDAVFSATDNTVVSLSGKAGEKAYSASNNFNLSLYTDTDRKIHWMDLRPGSNGLTHKMEVLGENGESVNIYADKLTVYEDMLYGVNVTEDNYISGKLFSARLGVKVTKLNDKLYTYDIYAKDFKTLTQTDGVIMFDVEAREPEVSIYYVDSNDGYSMNKLNVNTKQTAAVTLDNEPMKNVDYFAIGDGSIVYNDFFSKQIKLGSLKDNAVSGTSVVEVVDTVQYINYDRDNNRFFYVAAPADDVNRIKCVTFGETGFDMKEVFNAEKIRNLCVIDGSVYAKVGGEFKKCY